MSTTPGGPGVYDAGVNNEQDLQRLTLVEVLEDAALSPLTPKRQLFARNYLDNGFNGAKAARDAGYSQNCADREAYKLLRNPEVKRAILELAELVDSADPALGAAAIRQTLGEIRRNGSESGRLRAAELLGKVYGMFERGQPSQHLHLHADMPMKEREALLARARLRGRRLEDVPPDERARWEGTPEQG